jgi:ribonuclease HI
MKQVQIITDGSCIGNPGPGGWACILQFGNEERELSGSEAQTTNNRMEVTAAISGLKVLREPCDVELVTDSQYLKQGITQYLTRWNTNGWRTSDRRPVQNQDLWRELDELVSHHTIRVGLGSSATGIMTCRIVATGSRWSQRGGRRVVRFQRPLAPPILMIDEFRARRPRQARSLLF